MKEQLQILISGIALGAIAIGAIWYLSPEHIVENHIPETDTIYVDNFEETDSLQSVISLQEEKLSQLSNQQPKIIYANKKAPKPNGVTADAADHVFSTISEAVQTDSAQ